jgi:hypothetical protein
VLKMMVVAMSVAAKSAMYLGVMSSAAMCG